MKPTISVVVLCYNREDIIGRNLETLCDCAAHHGTLMEIIVVDNKSSDRTRDIAEEYAQRYPNIKVIANPGNFGVAKGRNTGMRVAQGDFVLVMDDDAIFKADQLRLFAEKLAASGNAGIICPRVINMPSGLDQCPPLVDVRLYGNFQGPCAAFRRELFAKIGYLDEECTFGGEEIDYSIRCHDAGYDIVYLGEVEVEHWGRERGVVESLGRREKWIYNYTRVLFKHFRSRSALLFSTRYSLSLIISSVRSLGFACIWRLVKSALAGASAGLGSRHLVGIETERFYRNKKIRPEYGNIPLTQKFLAKLRIV